MHPASSVRAARWLAVAVALVAAIAALGLATPVAAADAAGSADAPRPTATDASQQLHASTAAQNDSLVEPCAAEPPSDFAAPEGGTADTIGYVDGYWYNEPIDVNASDGLSDRELEVLTARTSARAEALRCLTFEEGVPPVEVVDRDELGQRTADQFANVSDRSRRFDTAVLRTMLLVGSEQDSIEVREETRTATVAGYYSPSTGQIVLVDPGGGGPSVDETVLVHEVGHALQDQNFDLALGGNRTTDHETGRLGLIEGDVSWIENRYLDRCENDRWAEPCVTAGAGGGGDGGNGSSQEPPNWGLYLQQFQPYSDGPTFVRSLYRDGGWDRVNAVYENPPNSTLFTMLPDTYGEVDLVEPRIGNASDTDWERMNVSAWPDYETVGPAGIGGMVIAPTYESGGRQNVVPPAGILNYNDDGNISEMDPLNYEQEPVEGWRGGRMAVFTRGNDTTTVWHTAWASGKDATQFADAYRDLLEIHNASAIEGADGRWRFAANSTQDGVVSVAVEGDRVVIVKGPSTQAVDALAGTAQTGEDGGSENGAIPGFGLAAALAGLLVAVLLGIQRRRGRR